MGQGGGQGGTVLRDGIWGDIALGPRELALVDTRAFQRLRRVRQLGFTDLVFPGATHSRFEHSLGVFHLAGLVLGRLEGRMPYAAEEDRRAFLAAALLHDVGHYPFSHAIEELEVQQVRRHEDIARGVICGDEMAPILRERWGVAPERVAVLVAGPRAGDAPLGEPAEILRAALDSGLDVDKLDYLVRDARSANVPYGMVDVERLIGCLAIWQDPDGRARLGVETKGVSALQSLVFAKHLMFATVYWHHACRAAVVMLLRAIQEGLRSEALPAAVLEGSDDAGLLRALQQEGSPPLSRGLAERLLYRRLYKRGLDIGIDHPLFAELERLWFRPADRAAVEDRWAEAVGAPAGSVLLDIPEPKPVSRDLPVILAGDEARAWDEVSGLSREDLDRFQRWVRKIRVFASDGSVAERLRERAAELLAGG